jgi:hypothetical protein
MERPHRIPIRTAALAVALCIVTPLAQAGAPGLSSMKRETRSSVGTSASSGQRLSRGASAGRGYASQAPRGASSRNLGSRGGSGQRASAGYDFGNSPILDALRRGAHDRYDGYRGRDYRRHDDDAAKALRAAAIATAVVGVVGILANSHQQAACAPQPVAVAAPPRGEYVTERVLVQPGHYEDVRVWIPETRDTAGRVLSGGYYELRKRWVPDVYEYRPVWVERY